MLSKQQGSHDILSILGIGVRPQFLASLIGAAYRQQLQGSRAHYKDNAVDTIDAQASEMDAHNAHVQQIFDTFKSEGIGENTLVVWISDNGSMYAFWPTSGNFELKGGKGDVTEGAV